MSDEQQDLNLEDVGAGAEDASGPRRGGLLSGVLLTILKWAAIGIGAVIIVVTTTIITVRLVNRGAQPEGLAAISPSYAAKTAPLASYDAIDSIRGQTADETPAIFLLRVSILYDQADKPVSVEIGQRVREIQDLMLKYVSRKTAAELQPSNYDQLQADLQSQINMIMSSGKVKRVVFREFTVVK